MWGEMDLNKYLVIVYIAKNYGLVENITSVFKFYTLNKRHSSPHSAKLKKIAMPQEFDSSTFFDSCAPCAVFKVEILELSEQNFSIFSSIYRVKDYFIFHLFMPSNSEQHIEL